MSKITHDIRTNIWDNETEYEQIEEIFDGLRPGLHTFNLLELPDINGNIVVLGNTERYEEVEYNPVSLSVEPTVNTYRLKKQGNHAGTIQIYVNNAHIRIIIRYSGTGSLVNKATIEGAIFDVTDEGHILSYDRVAIGHGAKAHSNKSLAIGKLAVVSENSESALALGDGASVNSFCIDSMAIGTSALVTGQYGLAIGSSASNTIGNGLAIGRLASNTGDTGLAIGYQASNTGQYGIVIGTLASNTVRYGLAIGIRASNTGQHGVAIGTSASNTTNNTVQLGKNGLSIKLRIGNKTLKSSALYTE